MIASASGKRTTPWRAAVFASLPLPTETAGELQGTPYSSEQIEDQLIFLGLAALSDPLRPEVPEAIRACHTAGIRVIMITGDYALTAASIGQQIGLGHSSPLQTFTGAQVSEMDDDRTAKHSRPGRNDLRPRGT